MRPYESSSISKGESAGSGYFSGNKRAIKKLRIALKAPKMAAKASELSPVAKKAGDLMDCTGKRGERPAAISVLSPLASSDQPIGFLGSIESDRNR